jgi:hypothetical protein
MVKNVFYSLLLWGTLCGICTSLDAMKHAVTYRLNGGRFGDNLQSLTQALWLSYTHNLRMLFQPFEYSEHLKVHNLCEHFTHTISRSYGQHIVIKGDSKKLTLLDSQSPSLYTTTFIEFPGLDPWSNHDFVEMVRALIAPIQNWNYPPLPADMHTIALHVRRGGNFDTDHTRTNRPFQFPSTAYYARAVQMLLYHLDGPWYVRLFTDDPNPEKIAHEIMAQCSPVDRDRITIEWRKKGNRHNAHVVEDFFDMMRFEYFVRARSNFSLFVERLGMCKIAIVPARASSGNPWGNVIEATVTLYGKLQSRTRSVTRKVIPFTRPLQKEECQTIFATSY